MQDQQIKYVERGYDDRQTTAELSADDWLKCSMNQANRQGLGDEYTDDEIVEDYNPWESFLLIDPETYK